MDFRIIIKDINRLSPVEVTTIYSRLSNHGRNMRTELEKRYIAPQPGNHETITLAMIWHNDLFVAWVGTRKVTESLAGELVKATSIECFTDPELRRHGFAQLGLQALITAGIIRRDKPVAVYREAAVALATKAGCTTVLLCDPDN